MIRSQLCPTEVKMTKGGVQLVSQVLEPPLFASLKLYVRALLAQPALLYWDDWGNRLTRHNDPFAVLIHEKLEPLMSELVGCPVKKSYVFLACYGDEGIVPDHIDREQCQYTLDLCVEDSGEPWPLIVDGEPHVLEENEGLVYPGIELPHRRDRKPQGKTAHLVFFHFVDADFSGSLD